MIFSKRKKIQVEFARKSITIVKREGTVFSILQNSNLLSNDELFVEEALEKIRGEKVELLIRPAVTINPEITTRGLIVREAKLYGGSVVFFSLKKELLLDIETKLKRYEIKVKSDRPSLLAFWNAVATREKGDFLAVNVGVCSTLIILRKQGFPPLLKYFPHGLRDVLLTYRDQLTTSANPIEEAEAALVDYPEKLLHPIKKVFQDVESIFTEHRFLGRVVFSGLGSAPFYFYFQNLGLEMKKVKEDERLNVIAHFV